MQTTLGVLPDRIEGLPEADNVIISALVAGDLDEDGLDDVVLAGNDDGTARVAVHRGGVAGPRDWLTDADAAWSVTSWLAWVAAVGDTDGDGKADLAIQTDAGVAVLRDAAVSVDPGTAPLRIGTDLVLSRGATAAGDPDEDGRADVWLADLDTFVLFDAAGTGISDDEAARVVVESAFAIHRSADLDGDGLRELLVSDSAADYDAVNATGTAWVFSPPFTGTIGAEVALATLHGHQQGSFTGRDLDAGDVDGDGTTDLVLCANDIVMVMNGLPLGEGLAVEQAEALIVPPGSIDGAAFGGDLDGDGAPDLAVAANDFDGGTRPYVALVPGPLSGGAVDLATVGSWGGPFEGYALQVSAGDLDADGLGDLMILSPDLGTVYLAGAP